MNLQKADLTVAGVVEVYDNLIDNCEEILQIIKNNAEWQNAVVGVSDSAEHVKEIRDNETTFFNPLSFSTSEELYFFAKKVWFYVDDYAKRHNFSFAAMEPVNINKYSPGQRYVPHADAGPNMPRVVSALVYLNDVEQGGETEFVYFNEKISPKKGRLIVFPSNYAYSHAAHPPINCEKYSAAFWFTGY